MPLCDAGKQVVVAAESSAALYVGVSLLVISSLLVTLMGALVSVGIQLLVLHCTFLGPEWVWPLSGGCAVVLMAIDLSRVVAVGFVGD